LKIAWNLYIVKTTNYFFQTSASKKQEAEGQTKTDPAKSPSDLNLDETSTGQDDTKTFPFKNSASYEVN